MAIFGLFFLLCLLCTPDEGLHSRSETSLSFCVLCLPVKEEMSNERIFTGREFDDLKGNLDEEV